MVTCPPPALLKPICFLPQLSCSEAWDQWPGALSPHPTRTSDVCSPVHIALPRGPPAGPSPSAPRLASPCRRGFGLVHRKNAGLFSRLIGVPSRCARLPAKCVTRVPRLTLPSWRQRQRMHPAPQAKTPRPRSPAGKEPGGASSRLWGSGCPLFTPEGLPLCPRASTGLRRNASAITTSIRVFAGEEGGTCGQKRMRGARPRYARRPGVWNAGRFLPAAHVTCPHTR